MSLRNLVAITALVITTLLTRGAGATTETTAPPPGVSPFVLASATLDVLPSAPALIGMERDTFAPGASRAIDVGAHGNVAVLESGELTLTFDHETAITRPATATTPSATRQIAAGAESVIAAGDALYLPGGGTGTISNLGTQPAALVVAFIGVLEGDPSGPPPAGPEGVSAELLALGFTETVPAAPGVLAMTRLGLDAGAVFASDGATPSLRLIVAESGPVDVTFDAAVVVTRAASHTPEPTPAGQPIRLNAGDVVLVPPSASGAFTNPGPATLTLLTASLQEASAGAEESVSMETGTTR